MSDLERRLLQLIDGATYAGWWSGDYESLDPDDAIRAALNYERIGDALAALVLLGLRRDDELLRTWQDYQ